LNNRLKKLKLTLLKPQSIAAGTISIMFFTIISKGLGFLREMILAANFGTSWRLDALIVAMEPAMTLGGIVSGSIASMMIPIYIDIKQKKDPAKIKEYTTQIMFISSLFLIAFGLVFAVFPHFFINIFAPKFGPKEYEYAIRKMTIIGFLPLILGFQSLGTSLLHAEKQYLLAAILQLVFNAVAIPVIILFAPFFSEASYLFAFILGTIFIDIALLFILRKKIIPKKIFRSFSNFAIRKTIILSLPLLLSGSLGIINGIVDKAFASSLEAGSISAIRYAQTIKMMITSIIIGSLMTTLFTELSEISAKNDKKALEFRLRKTSTDLLNFMIPLTFWLIAMARPLISLLYERGEFTSDSTHMVTLAFLGYSITMIISPVYHLLIRLFTAYKMTKIPFLITIISIIMNFVFNWLLIKRFKVLGLTLSTSLVAYVNLVVLNIIQKKTFNLSFFNVKKIATILASSAALFLVSFLLKTFLHPIIWSILTNFAFLLLFFYFNKDICLRILSSVKKRIRSRKTINK